MELRITVTAKGKIFDGQAPEIMKSELTAAMYEATQLLETNIKRLTPVGVSGAQGGLVATIHGEVVTKGTPVIKGIVAHGSKYGDIIEKGRTAGKTWPPEGALLEWIKVKLGVEGREANKLEFVIRRKIGRKGFEGAHMFEKGLDASMSKLTEIFDTRGFIIARKLNEK